MSEHQKPSYSISVNPDLCAASGVCARMAPNLFKLDDCSDTAEVVHPIVSDEDVLARVKEVARHCPTWAIEWRPNDTSS